MTRGTANQHLHSQRTSEDLPTVFVRSPRHSYATRSRQHAFTGEGSIDRTSSGMSESSASASPRANSIPIKYTKGSSSNHHKPHSSHHHHHPHHHHSLLSSWSNQRTWMAFLNTCLILLVHRLLLITSTQHAELFYVYYQPFAPFIVMLWLWAVNVWYFEKHHIRYDICFSVEEQKHLLPSTAIFDIANVLSTVVLSSAAVFLFYCIQGALETAAVQPPLIYSLMLVILLLPFTVFYQDTRRFFATTAWRVMTPIRGVAWADFLLADILTSLAKGISDVERAVCLMASGSVMSPAADVCNDASWVIPAGLALPYLWRLMQCLRVHADTGAKTQLWNALKYFTAFPVIALSAVKYHVEIEVWRGFYKPMWLAAAMLNSGFSYFWDIERDWEISFFSQMKSKKSLAVQPVLQPVLQYNKLFYMYLMVSNALLRLLWTYKLSPHLRRNHTAVFIVVCGEAFRRSQWIFVRIEVELRKIQAARPELGQLVPAISHNTSGGGPQQLAPVLGGDVAPRSGKSGLLEDEENL